MNFIPPGMYCEWLSDMRPGMTQEDVKTLLREKMNAYVSYNKIPRSTYESGYATGHISNDTFNALLNDWAYHMFNSISAEQNAVEENARGAAARAAANAAGAAARATNVSGKTSAPSFFGSLFGPASAPTPMPMPITRARAASPPRRGGYRSRKSRRRLTRRR